MLVGINFTIPRGSALVLFLLSAPLQPGPPPLQVSAARTPATDDGRWNVEDGADRTKAESPWIDPDTPEGDRKIVSLPLLLYRNDVEREFDLVFSDEFNLDGRTMNDGRDPRWTALHSDDLTNNPLHWYSHDAVKTTNGVLNITLDVHPETFTYTDHTSKEIKSKATHRKINVTKEFRSGMLQSWNKFCFVGGIIEMSAKLPGDPHTGGLWPASE
jgi:beta-glucan synthesis-associated protein KRE6